MINQSEVIVIYILSNCIAVIALLSFVFFFCTIYMWGGGGGVPVGVFLSFFILFCM